MFQTDIEDPNIIESTEKNENDLNEKALKETEDDLAEQLRTICKEEKNIDKENNLVLSKIATILHKMRRIYYKRSPDMISLIRSAALYNAAIVRSSENTEEIEQDLKLLCEEILTQANVKQKSTNLIEHSKEVRNSVISMRKKVSHQLFLIKPISGEQTEKLDITKLENEKIEFIKNLQDEITDNYIQIMADLAKFCFNVMGESPCKFTLAGMGSLARKEITPYSDFEHIILLQEDAFDNLPESEKEKSLNYFKWFSVIFQTVIINLQETIIPSVAIPSLNSVEYTFFDNITNRGISFDGMMPHACKSPLGRQEHTKDKPFKTELIKPVKEMLQYLNTEEKLKHGYKLGDVLTKTCFVYGDHDIFDCFQNGVLKQLEKEHENDLAVMEEGRNMEHNFGKMQVKSQIVSDLQNYATRSTLFKVFLSKKLDIKKIVYRSTTLFIAELGRIYDIHSSSSFEIVEKLAAINILSDYAKHKLMFAVAVACEIRLRWYMKNGKQTDLIEKSENNDKKIITLQDLVGKFSIISYFQIAYALQCDLAKRMHLKKLYFYSNPLMLNVLLNLNDTQYLRDYAKYQLKDDGNERLRSFDDCLKKLEMQKHEFNDSNSDLKLSSVNAVSETLHKIGAKFKEDMIYDDAIEFFKMSICILHEENQRVHNSTGTVFKLIRSTSFDFENQFLQAEDQENKLYSESAALWVACLHDIGHCYLKLYRPNKAMKYYKAALPYLNKFATHDHDNNKIIHKFENLYGTGSCLIYMGKYAEAKDKLEHALQIADTDSINDIDHDKVADVQINMGTCLLLMSKQMESKKYFKEAFQTKKKLQSSEKCPKKSSEYLREMSQCTWFSHQKQKAIKYLEMTLKIKEEISHNPKSDIIIATILGELGIYLMAVNPYKARNVFQRSLEIFEEATLDCDADRTMALTLLFIGKNWGILKNSKLAKLFNKKAYKIIKDTCCNENADVLFLSSTYQIGETYVLMENYTDAIGYYEKVLHVQESLLKQSDASNGVIHNLKNIGYCFSLSNQPEESLPYFHQALSLQTDISFDSATEIGLADILMGICTSLSDLNKFSDALIYAERALSIIKLNSLDIETDLNLINILEIIALCYENLMNCEENVRFLKMALLIKQSNSADIQSDSKLIIILSQIGFSLCNSGNILDALKYFERLLLIQEKNSLDVERDKELIRWHTVIGNLYDSGLEDYKTALDHYLGSLFITFSLSTNFHINLDLVSCLKFVGKSLFCLQLYMESKQYYKKALEILSAYSKNSEIECDIIFCFGMIGRCLFKMVLYEDAVVYFKKALNNHCRFSSNRDSDIQFALNLEMLAQCLFEMKQFEESLRYFKEALGILEKNSLDENLTSRMISILQQIGSCLMELQLSQEASEYFTRAASMQDYSPNERDAMMEP